MAFLKKETVDNRTRYTLFGIKISFKNKKDFAKIFRENNLNNEVELLNDCDISKIKVGKRSYGSIKVEMNIEESEQLVIGNYCSIGPDVKFILSSEHPYKGLSTFPFKVKLGLQKLEAKSKGSIVIDDDVWIGLGSIINSGVHIGQGAIIASGSVVVKDVEPYSIVGGNPARHIKYRFDSAIREKLLKFDFSNLDEEKVKLYISDMYSELTIENIDAILQKVK